MPQKFVKIFPKNGEDSASVSSGCSSRSATTLNTESEDFKEEDIPDFSKFGVDDYDKIIRGLYENDVEWKVIVSYIGSFVKENLSDQPILKLLENYFVTTHEIDQNLFEETWISRKNRRIKKPIDVWELIEEHCPVLIDEFLFPKSYEKTQIEKIIDLTQSLLINYIHGGAELLKDSDLGKKIVHSVSYDKESVTIYFKNEKTKLIETMSKANLGILIYKELEKWLNEKEKELLTEDKRIRKEEEGVLAMKMLSSIDNSTKILSFLKKKWAHPKESNYIQKDFLALVEDVEYEKKLNISIGLIPTKHGKIYDFDKKETRERTIDDLFTFECQIDPDMVVNQEKKDDALRILNELVGYNEEKLQVLSTFSILAMSGDVSKEIFLYLLGGSGCGKSTYIKIMNLILGKFAKKGEKDLFLVSNLKTKGQGPNSAKMALVGARFVHIDEINASDTIDVGTLANATGQDGETARDLHSKQTEFDQTALFAFNGNYIFKIPGDAVALVRRGWIIPFKSRFVYNQEETDEITEKNNGIYLRNDKLKDQISKDKEYLTAFFQIFIENGVFDLTRRPDWAEFNPATDTLDQKTIFINWIYHFDESRNEIEGNYILNFDILGENGIKPGSIVSDFLKTIEKIYLKNWITTTMTQWLFEAFADKTGLNSDGKTVKCRYCRTGTDYRYRFTKNK